MCLVCRNKLIRGERIKMKKMYGAKKYVLGFLFMIVFVGVVGCSKDSDAKSVDATNKKVEKTVVASEKTEEASKTEPIEANFAKVIGDEIEVGTKVYVIGDVAVTKADDISQFRLNTEEKDGAGMYTIKNQQDIQVEHNDVVKLSGIYDGKDDMNTPVIKATKIEYLK